MTDSQIRENLKKFRIQKNPVSPFQVFRDSELEELLKIKPQNMMALTSIKGFPKNGSRVVKYGEDIIKFFKNGCKVDNMSVF